MGTFGYRKITERIYQADADHPAIHYAMGGLWWTTT
jgi:hypothetical protein